MAAEEGGEEGFTAGGSGGEYYVCSHCGRSRVLVIECFYIDFNVTRELRYEINVVHLFS